MKELCKEQNKLYEKQNDLKGQKWKIEKLLERKNVGRGGCNVLYFIVVNQVWMWYD